MIAELVERTEGVVDGGGELTFRLVATLGGKVLPEHRVVGVTTEVEREVLLQLGGLRSHRAVVAGLGQLLEGRVGAGDVGRVVLAVVQLHDLRGDVRLEGRVVVGQFRKRVLSHEGPFICGPVGPSMFSVLLGFHPNS